MKYIYIALDIDGCLSDGKGKIINADYLQQLRTTLANFPITPFFCSGRSAPYVEAMSQAFISVPPSTLSSELTEY